jgi:hypothetical protein
VEVRRRTLLVAAAATLAALSTTLPTAMAVPVPGAPSCPMTPADSYWHADVSRLPVHPRSAAYVASMGTGGHVHADFGSGTWNGGPIGIPFTTVAGSQPGVAVRFDYDDESDPGPYRIPAGAPIEGGPSASGDRHVLVVDRDRCVLMELYAAYPRADGTWDAGSGAVWDLRSNAMRPAGWTSADAAGLPILPGLVRYEEVAAGEIDHAIRVTANRTQNGYVWPARHQAGDPGADLPPMGLRMRLKSNVDISGFAPHAQVILLALKRYGMIVADNGSSWYLSGAPDERWSNEVLHLLHQIDGADFEAVDTTSIMADPSSGRTKAPYSVTQLGHYVDAAYRDFLGRAPDAGGRSYWVQQLSSGLPPIGFTNALSRSDEWMGAVVTGIFQAALGRGPDPGGLAYWRDRLRAGARVVDVTAAVQGSPEMWWRAGSTPEGFVDRIYQLAHGRGPDGAGRAYWSGEVRRGVPLSTIAAALHQSREARLRRVAGLYQKLLARAPDSAGASYWADVLLRDDDVKLAALLASSDEYIARAQP